MNQYDIGSDERVCKSYVWHEGQCFFVSTIERDSSAMLGPRRYNETIVWKYDWEKAERGELVYQTDDSKGSVATHLNVVRQISRGNYPWALEEKPS